MAIIFDHKIVGTFHSHPTGLAEPGKSDIFNAVDDSWMLIFDVFGKTCALWHIENKVAKKMKFDIIYEAQTAGFRDYLSLKLSSSRLLGKGIHKIA